MADGSDFVLVNDDKTTADASAPPSPEQPVKYAGIAILGSHPQTKMQAPFDQDNWLVYACSPDNSPYGLSEHRRVLPRVDVWFELHRPIAHPTRPYGYLRWLEDIGVPIIMRDRDAMPFFKTAVAYPEKAVKERFGEMLFTSSVAYIMAKAILDCEAMKIPNLGLFGIMQQGKEEFLRHQTGTKQMIWNAHRAGLQVVTPQDAGHLFQPPPEDW